jgi:hypothetical protein
MLNHIVTLFPPEETFLGGRIVHIQPLPKAPRVGTSGQKTEQKLRVEGITTGDGLDKKLGLCGRLHYVMKRSLALCVRRAFWIVINCGHHTTSVVY